VPKKYVNNVTMINESALRPSRELTDSEYSIIGKFIQAYAHFEYSIRDLFSHVLDLDIETVEVLVGNDSIEKVLSKLKRIVELDSIDTESLENIKSISNIRERVSFDRNYLAHSPALVSQEEPFCFILRPNSIVEIDRDKGLVYHTKVIEIPIETIEKEIEILRAATENINKALREDNAE